MNKIYITPKQKEIKINTTQMLAGSIDGLSDELENEVVTTTDYVKQYKSLWDEEW